MPIIFAILLQQNFCIKHLKSVEAHCLRRQPMSLLPHHTQMDQVAKSLCRRLILFLISSFASNYCHLKSHGCEKHMEICWVKLNSHILNEIFNLECKIAYIKHDQSMFLSPPPQFVMYVVIIHHKMI